MPDLSGITKIDEARAYELDKTKTYMLYCNGVVCWRSPAAALTLKHLGFDLL
ncbi:MAG: hypothetical protein N2327_01550 [Caldimicrobium sp.]|nr:hypothetical protein [Caldimicrobium sp.]MCX7873103.1 hypothetical protein [Caldimicrobium sp.]MDW8094528.1 hypothetical protein [Caldimicrobium sp.]